MRYLFYASNGHGLGHVMRTLGIARALRRQQPSATIMFLTNSEAPHLISGDGFPVVKMLSPPPGIEQRDENVVQINRSIAHGVITGFDPDVMAVDFFPVGQLGALNWIRGHRSFKIFIAREPNPNDPNAQQYAENIEAIYDLIIAPHRPEETVVLPRTTKPVHYVGPILVRSRDEALRRDIARQALGIRAEAFLVYVGFGGGGRRDLARARAWVLSVVDRFSNWTFAFAKPPLDRSPPGTFPTPNVIEFSYAPLAECWAAFDLAISSLSFNSTAELLHHGVPAAFIEMRSLSDDWARRGRMIAKAGAGLTVRVGDRPGLIRALDDLTSEPRRAEIRQAAMAMIPDNGAERAAAVILGATQ
jgi:UDP-N-acetylglucosamine--N-acetylmuramyl-(pentapeptide) pyrophosphoryl-undecaprenol N-acetylglucosamine transferase